MKPYGLNNLRLRLDGIRSILMAHRDAGAALPSAVKGTERETLVREFLARVFPPPYRFGTGAIIDATGATSGQLDIVVEFPFLPSFPTPGAEERLYLAESAALVIEVKSDLTAQWSEVKQSARKVLPLRRNWHAHGALTPTASASFAASTSRVPFLVVAYRGPREVQTLQRKIADTDTGERSDAVLVVESGTYSGCPLCPWTVSGVGAIGVLGFSVDTAWLARNGHVGGSQPGAVRCEPER